MLTRRKLLKLAGAIAAHATLAKTVRAQTTCRLTINATRPQATIPASFIGLGYEISSAARLGLLSVSNKPYLQLIRNLGQGGVLRLGGIVADFTSYSPDGAVIAEPKHTVVTRASLQQLRAFLDAVDWTAIWSLNFGSGTLEEAVAEARAVKQILGPRLLAIELGNEVENYGHGKSPLRPSPYTYDRYRREYSQWRTSILAAVPGLSFAAPDTASSVEWVERMAADSHNDVQLLTTHYYRGDQKLGTRDLLLHPDPTLKTTLERLRTASHTSGIPWRMCETNSFYGGGRPGLSNTLAGALWTLDFMLLLAQYGCAGINLETGVNQLGFISSYSPIQDDEAGHNTAGVPYYGMLAFAEATANAPEVFPVDITPASDNLTAYALGEGNDARKVALINKSAGEPLAVSLRNPPSRRASSLLLTGPSLDSKTGVTFGGAEVDADGRWAASKPDTVTTASLTIPPATALLLHFL